MVTRAPASPLPRARDAGRARARGVAAGVAGKIGRFALASNLRRIARRSTLSAYWPSFGSPFPTNGRTSISEKPFGPGIFGHWSPTSHSKQPSRCLCARSVARGAALRDSQKTVRSSFVAGDVGGPCAVARIHGARCGLAWVFQKRRGNPAFRDLEHFTSVRCHVNKKF
jgi:hypothetical protein